VIHSAIEICTPVAAAETLRPSVVESSWIVTPFSFLISAYWHRR
jgi:hypothetical protein